MSHLYIVYESTFVYECVCACVRACVRACVPAKGTHKHTQTHTNTLHYTDIHHITVVPLIKQGPLAEQYSNIIIFGQRRKTPLNRTTYGIKMSAVNDSHAYAGLYVCAFERRHDKMYAVSLMKLAGSPPPLPHAPTAAVKSCSAENYDKEKQVIFFIDFLFYIIEHSQCSFFLYNNIIFIS